MVNYSTDKAYVHIGCTHGADINYLGLQVGQLFVRRCDVVCSKLTFGFTDSEFE